MFKPGDLVRLNNVKIYGPDFNGKDAIIVGPSPRFAQREGVLDIEFVDKTLYHGKYPCYEKHLEYSIIEGDDDPDCI